MIATNKKKVTVHLVGNEGEGKRLVYQILTGSKDQADEDVPVQASIDLLKISDDQTIDDVQLKIIDNCTSLSERLEDKSDLVVLVVRPKEGTANKLSSFLSKRYQYDGKYLCVVNTFSSSHSPEDDTMKTLDNIIYQNNMKCVKEPLSSTTTPSIIGNHIRDVLTR